MRNESEDRTTVLVRPRANQGGEGGGLELRSPEDLRGLLDVALFEQKGTEGVPTGNHPSPRLTVLQPCVDSLTRRAKEREVERERGTKGAALIAFLPDPESSRKWRNRRNKISSFHYRMTRFHSSHRLHHVWFGCLVGSH